MLLFYSSCVSDRLILASLRGDTRGEAKKHGVNPKDI